VAWHHGGGILSALHILKDHWGAVGRDLAHAHYTWNQICTDTLPLDQFIAFVVYAPPGTAVFHKLFEGWTADTYKLAELIEWNQMLLSINAEDPQHAFDQLPKQQRPGQKPPEPEKHMTIGEYMKLAGMEGADD
jgi:hypothetical protein